jgi:integrase
LTAHPNGQWCKKILGKVHFFGVWADPDAALTRYHGLAADLHAGRQASPSRVAGGGLTVKEVCNAFLNWQKEKAEAGEIGLLWFEDCRRMVSAFAQAVGKSRPVSDLCPDDFQRYRIRLAKTLGVHALTRQITAIRSVFKYAQEFDLIDRPIRSGMGLVRPSAAQKRKAKSKRELETGRRLFTREELLEILEASNPTLRTAVLLGLNGGFGNADCATLPISAIDFNAGVVKYDRPKTGVRRVVPLWQETLSALNMALHERRPIPANEEAAKLVLLTSTGRSLLRQTVTPGRNGEPDKISKLDLVCCEFTALLRRLSIDRPRIGFYTLRHTFRTWADEVRDQHAIHLIMGHTIPGMSGIYVEEISLDRLRAVVNHVRSKIFSQ